MLLVLVVSAIAVAAVAGCAIAARRFASERAEVQRVRAIFSRYVSPQVAEELLTREKLRAFEGRQRYATILVCRIWNFAHFAEGLTTEETLRYLNEFYAVAGTSIQKHRGMIDRFLGDGIVGAFGCPLDDPHQHEHALKAALDIVRLVDAMRERWAAQGRRPFRAGIGINSGNIIAGDVGFSGRRDFMIIGHEVRVAAQLQEATNELSAYIIASKATCEHVRDTFALVPVKRVPLHGMRAIADAFIVRGLQRHEGKDGLLLPPAAAFRQTTIVEPPAAVEVPEVAAPVAARSPSAQAVASARREAAEAEIPRFSSFDDVIPMLPDVPIHATYEDTGGPPFELPP